MAEEQPDRAGGAAAGLPDGSLAHGPADVRQVVAQRLAAQQLTGPRASSVAQAVRNSLAVQAQDPPLARWSLGMRAGVDDAAVCSAIDSGEVLRTHVLRPTWHFVHRDDIRWLLELTGPKIVSGNRARQRQLGIDDSIWSRAERVLQECLSAGPMTRRQLQPLLPAPESPQPNQTVAHLLLIAEALGLICSGPLLDGEHSYLLLDDVVPASASRSRSEMATELVHRFVAGHGPTSLRDLQRWSNITRTEARAALASGGLEQSVVDGVELWRLPGTPDHGQGGVLLLPNFDETILSHDRPRFPRQPGHRLGEMHLNPGEMGNGFVIVDGVDVGSFRLVRRSTGGVTRREVEVELAPGVQEICGHRVAEAADRLIAFFR